MNTTMMAPHEMDRRKALEPAIREMLVDLNDARDALRQLDGGLCMEALNALERKLGAQLPPVNAVLTIRLNDAQLKAG